MKKTLLPLLPILLVPALFGCAAAGGSAAGVAGSSTLAQIGVIVSATAKVGEAIARTAPALIKDGENLVAGIKTAVTVVTPIPTNAPPVSGN